MLELDRYDTSELEKELERRKREKQKRDKPQPVSNPDWSVVQRYCQQYIDSLYTQGGVRDDDQHFIFEAATEAVFGKGVWSWINARS